MRDLIKTFIADERGASLVEYAVALVVVTLVGGAGVIAVGNQGATSVDSACDIVAQAADPTNAAASC